MIAHIVLFSLKPDLTEQDRGSFARSARSAFTSIATVKSARLGSAVNVDAGYPRCFGDSTYEFAVVLEFEDEDGLRAYLQHPFHEELGGLFWRCCEKTVISEVEWVDLERLEVGG